MARTRRVKYHVRRRLFLNRNQEKPALIIGVVEDTREMTGDDPNQPWKWGTIILELGDCYRRVSFDFDMETRADRSNSLYKIRRIAEVVNAVRDAIEIEAASINARPEVQDKKE